MFVPTDRWRPTATGSKQGLRSEEAFASAADATAAAAPRTGRADAVNFNAHCVKIECETHSQVAMCLISGAAAEFCCACPNGAARRTRAIGVAAPLA